MESAAEHSSFAWSLTKWIVTSLGVGAPIIFGLLELQGGLDLTGNQELKFFRLLIGGAIAAATAALLYGLHRVVTDSQLELLAQSRLSASGKRLGNVVTTVIFLLQILAMLAFMGFLIGALIIVFSPNANKRMAEGESIEAEGAKVTLDSTRIVPPTNSQQPEPGNVFVAAHLTFENMSGEPITVSDALDLTLKDLAGHSVPQLPHSEEQRLVKESLSEGSLDRNATMSGEAVYEVPCDAQGLHLEYNPFSGDITHTWLIGGAGEGACENKV